MSQADHPDLVCAGPTHPSRPLTVQLPLHTIQAFKQQLHRNGDGSSKDTKAKVNCLVWKNSASFFPKRKYTANNIHMGTHRHFLRRAPLRCGSWNCPASPGYHETVLEASHKKGKKEKESLSLSKPLLSTGTRFKKPEGFGASRKWGTTDLQKE